jgi:hypothetical protein
MLAGVRCSLRALGLALVVSAALASCGDEQKDRQEDGAAPVAAGSDPEVVVDRYFAALARGDARAVCGLLTAAGRQALTQLPEGERPATCEGAAKKLGRDTLPIRQLRLQDFQPSGRTATARITSDRPPYDSGVLLEMDEGWRIAYPPAVLSKFDTPPGIRPHEEEEEHGRR